MIWIQARVHHAARRRGSRVAARGASAAGGKAADHWVPGHDHAFSLEPMGRRSEEHTSELQSRGHLVCRLLLEKKKIKYLRSRPSKLKSSNSILSTAGIAH